MLTLFERLTGRAAAVLPAPDEAPGRGTASGARPQADERGEILHTLKGKPAAVVNRLRGKHHLAPDTRDCAVGTMPSRMHLAGRDFPHQPNLRGLAWWEVGARSCCRILEPHARELIEAELLFQRHVGASAPCRAAARAIHADLFRDNVMFEDDALTGFFDFYFAGVDTFLFDIAVCLNDWCIDLESGRLVEERAGAVRRRLRRRAPADRQRAAL